MLKFYLTSVLIYMIIIYCESKMFKDDICKNGWLNNMEKKKNNKIGTLFCMSAIPIIRVIIVIMFCVMFIYPKEKVNAWIEENKKEE